MEDCSLWELCCCGRYHILMLLALLATAGVAIQEILRARRGEPLGGKGHRGQQLRAGLRPVYRREETGESEVS